MLTFAACQDKDFDIQPAKVQPIEASQFTCELQGDDYVISWPASTGLYGVQVTTLKGETPQGNTSVVGDTKFVHKDMPTNVDYTYVIKAMDEKGNLSTGAILKYTRKGADPITDVTLVQIDKVGGYDMSISWAKGNGLSSVKLTATNGSRNISETLPGTATSYLVSDVKEGEEWNIKLIAENAEGPSLSAKSSLKIGKTKIGYLSIYDTVEELVANGDDDEVAGWAWLSKEYVSAEFVPFSSIKNASDLESFRVLFWMRDIEVIGGLENAVFNMPQVVLDATPAIKTWYHNGGSLLLWGHAGPYIGHLDRLIEGAWRAPGSDFGVGFNDGPGNYNPDRWSLAVCLSPGENSFQKEHINHPLFKGMRDVEYNVWGRTTLVPFKSGGWTEDHNCLFFNYPSKITGLGNQDEACYDNLVNKFGIIPLGTWDSQINWIGQFNVWEAGRCEQHVIDKVSPAVTIPAIHGTVICIGNGGCNFNMKDRDGSFQRDLDKLPSSNNGYQDNINRLAKNALEYLKTK